MVVGRREPLVYILTLILQLLPLLHHFNLTVGESQTLQFTGESILVSGDPNPRSSASASPGSQCEPAAVLEKVTCRVHDLEQSLSGIKEEAQYTSEPVSESWSLFVPPALPPCR